MGHPQQIRACHVMVSEADSLRVNRLIVKLGSIRAATSALGCCSATFAAARDQGRMMAKTRIVLLEALERAAAAS